MSTQNIIKGQSNPSINLLLKVVSQIKDQFMDQFEKTSQELRMLSSDTLNCQVTMIVMNSGSQLSEMSAISHKLTSHVMLSSWCLYLSLSFVFDHFV